MGCKFVIRIPWTYSILRGLRVKKFPTFELFDETLKKQWTDTLSIFSFALMDIIIISKKEEIEVLEKENSWNTTSHQNFKCGSSGCPYCGHILGGNMFRASSNQREYEIKYFFNCNTNYVIYLVTCDICYLQIVGQATRRLKGPFLWTCIQCGQK